MLTLMLLASCRPYTCQHLSCTLVATCAFHSIWVKNLLRGFLGQNLLRSKAEIIMIMGDEPANRQFFDAVFSW